MNDLVLTNIWKSYGDKTVLEDFSYCFSAGKVTCILGPSGCGKTTLLRVLAGLESADSGSLEGRPDRIAFVFQEDRLCEDFTAVSNLKLVGISKSAALTHLAELGLAADVKKPLREYSGGMKRRVSIARAMCYNAELVLLDEPFKGLDETMKKTVMDYVLRYTKGKTVLCVTHEPAEADYLGGEVLRMPSLRKGENNEH